MKSLGLALLILSLVPAAAFAGPGRGPGHHGGPMMRHLAPPELVMRHQAELGLTDTQREQIKQVMKEAEPELVDLRWRAEAAREKLEELLGASRVDENQALVLSDRLMAAQQLVHKAQLRMMIRIKNLLTEEQQAKLKELRPKGMKRGGFWRQGKRPPRQAE